MSRFILEAVQDRPTGYYKTLTGVIVTWSIHGSSDDLEWPWKAERDWASFAGESPHVRSYRLINGDQIRHGNPCGEGACL